MESCDEFYLYDDVSKSMIGVAATLLVPVAAANATKFVLVPATGCPSGAAALSTTASYTLRTAGSTPSSVYINTATAVTPCAAKLKVIATPVTGDVLLSLTLDRLPTEANPSVSLQFSVGGTAYNLGLCGTTEYGGTAQAGSKFIFRSTPTAPGDTPVDTPKMSTGALVGIIVGSVATVLFILAVLFFFLDKKRREKRAGVISATPQAAAPVTVAAPVAQRPWG